jgi:hydrogenase maturation factor
LSFLPGKIPTEVLQKIVFKNLGYKREDVILNPSIGEDAAIVKAGKQILAISSDPITGAEKYLGWLAVHVNANDVATRGIQPLWFNSIILLPKNSTKKIVKKICSQMDKAAKQLQLSIIGGHCEVTPGIDHPIVTGCAIGVANKGKYVSCSGARIGDKIILTKGTGIEGTAILASDLRKELLNNFDAKFLKKAEKYFEKISVVKDALTAFQSGGVTAMHDPTEGGVAGGLHELCDAANVGVRVYEESILVPKETQKICEYFKIDPFQLISSGSLLIVTEENKEEEIISRLSKHNIQSSIIGKIVDSALGRKFVTKAGHKIELVRPETDHLWKVLGR